MPVQEHLPNNNSHVTFMSREDMIEEYGGMVDAQIVKSSIMRNFVDMPLLRGTDTKTVRRMGDSTLQRVGDAEAGQEMAATPRNFDRAQVTVDTIILAREVRTLLNELQTDFNARREIAIDHGKQIGKFFDASLLSMGVKAALSKVTAGIADGAIRGNKGRDLGDAFKSGQSTELVAVGDELDPDALYAAIESIIIGLQENDVDTDEQAVFVRPRQHAVLLNNDKLINRDFSRDNGDFADGTIKTVMGVPIVSTARLADRHVDLSLLGSAYVPTARELRVQALVLHPQTLLGAEAIPLTSNIHYSDLRLSWYIDSYISYAASTRRPDQTGVVLGAAS